MKYTFYGFLWLLTIASVLYGGLFLAFEYPKTAGTISVILFVGVFSYGIGRVIKKAQESE